jgi:hypothetical protein
LFADLSFAPFEQQAQLQLLFVAGVLELMSFRCVRAGCDLFVQPSDFSKQFDFGRHDVRVLEHRLPQPKLFRRSEIFVEVERLPLTGGRFF